MTSTTNNFAQNSEKKSVRFSGNIFIFHNFDVGDDIDLEKIKTHDLLVRRPVALSKYFKNYHIPLVVELPQPETSPHLTGIKLHNFGVITLRYQIPFDATLEELRAHINDIDDHYREQSIADAGIIFGKIKNYVTQPKFFHLRRSYVLIQVNIDPAMTDVVHFKHEYGHLITSILRFETETLSDYQRNEMLEDAIGYYHGDLIIIDTDAAFAYDDEYEDKLDIFEFANIQYLELQYFDRVLDKRLNVVYEGKAKELPWHKHLPLLWTTSYQPVGELDQLKVDISVITDRLENSMKLSGDAYYSELYLLLFKKLDLQSWKESIHNKLSIIHDLSMVHQNRLESSRQDFLSIVIIILIFIEILVGLVKN